MRILMRHAFLACAPLMLAACVMEPPASPAEPDADACKAAGYQGLVGQPASVVAQMQFPIGSRVIGPNDPVTADFNPERLNVEIGRNGRIDKVACY